MMPTSLDRGRIRVLLLEGIHPSARETFHRAGYTHVDCYPKSLPRAELAAALKDAYLVGIRSATRLDADLLQSAPRLLAAGCFCIGTDQVELEAARDRGIAVFNAPFSNTRSVAELVLAEIILLMRGIPVRNLSTHRGGWMKSANGCHEVRGKTLGIVGYGHIGTQLGLLAEALGMSVVFHDIEKKLALGNARQTASLEEVLEHSDAVTLHVPETSQTHGLIGAAQFAAMRRGVCFLNASRGSVVDIEALAVALRSGHVASAAIDVFPEEPRTQDDEFLSPLRGMENVLLTPHIGGSTEEAQRNIGIEVAEKLIRYSDNGSTLSAVNFPQVALPEHAGQHRLLHIHRNQPGVLSALNAIFSESAINITGQYLQTDARLGYVVIDIESDGRAESLELKRRLDQVAGTIRTRVLY